MKSDRSQDNFAYLRMSFLTGPHEGWVAVDRNPLALGVFSELPRDLAEMALTEFKDLVASAYYDEAVKVLVGPGWPVRDILLHRLEDAPVEARRQFAQSARTSPTRVVFDSIWMDGLEMIRCATSVDFSMSMSG